MAIEVAAESEETVSGSGFGDYLIRALALCLGWLLTGSLAGAPLAPALDTPFPAEALIVTNPERALAEAQELVASLSGRGDPQALALARLVAGKAALALNQLDLAERFLETAASALAQTGNPQQQMLVDYALARLSFQRGDFAETERRIVKGLEKSPSAADLRVEAALWNLSGWAAARQGRFAEAVERYQRSVTLQRSRGDPLAIALSLNNLGNAWKNLGQPSLALDLHLEALALRRAGDDQPGVTQSLSNLVLVYQQLGDLAAALRYSEEAVRRTQLVKNSDEALRIQLNHAELLVKTGRYPEALALLEPLDVAIRAAQPLFRRAGLSTWALALQGSGRLPEAQQMAASSVQLARVMDEPKELIDALDALAQVLQAQNLGAPAARQSLEEAVTLAEQTHSAPQERVLRLRLAELAEQRGDLAEALKQRRRFEALTEATGGVASARRIAVLERQLANAEQTREMAQLRATESLQAALISRQRWIGVLGLTTLGSLLLLLGWRMREVQRRQQIAERNRAELAAKNAELERLANTDALTGLGNRKWLREQLERLADMPAPQALAILDIDLFKRINDAHGHDVGDAVLVAYAGMLKQCLGGVARIGRWGGEEFLLLFSGHTAVAASAALEALRVELRKLEVPADGIFLQVRFSAGVAEKTPDMGVERWLKCADQALYRAKENGRDRIELVPAVA